MADHQLAPASCRVAAKIDGLKLGWSSGVRLHVSEPTLVLDSDVGRVTMTRDSIRHIDRVRAGRAHGLRIVMQGSDHYIWSFHPGEIEATFAVGGWPLREVRSRFIGPCSAFRGGASFATDRALVSSAAVAGA